MSKKGMTVSEVIDTMNEQQKNVMYYFVGRALEDEEHKLKKLEDALTENRKLRLQVTMLMQANESLRRKEFEKDHTYPDDTPLKETSLSQRAVAALTNHFNSRLDRVQVITVGHLRKFKTKTSLRRIRGVGEKTQNEIWDFMANNL